LGLRYACADCFVRSLFSVSVSLYRIKSCAMLKPMWVHVCALMCALRCVYAITSWCVGSQVRKLMESIDMDCDGVVTVDELRTWVRNQARQKEVRANDEALCVGVCSLGFEEFFLFCFVFLIQRFLV